MLVVLSILFVDERKGCPREAVARRLGRTKTVAGGGNCDRWRCEASGATTDAVAFVVVVLSLM